MRLKLPKPAAGGAPSADAASLEHLLATGALQHHVSTEHFKQSESTFPCELCGELFTSQAQLDGHLESEHPKVMGTETQATSSQMVQVRLGSLDVNRVRGFL